MLLSVWMDEFLNLTLREDELLVEEINSTLDSSSGSSANTTVVQEDTPFLVEFISKARKDAVD